MDDGGRHTLCPLLFSAVIHHKQRPSLSGVASLSHVNHFVLFYIKVFCGTYIALASIPPLVVLN